ncbi:MAG: hypothetical protein EOO88_39775 [Pedobacter sp.]|nr:MAG: hypothetical protein EOO88_39775 [Pedobacter sp.]
MKKIVLYASLTMILFSCVTTTTKTKDPIIGNVEILQSGLRQLVPAKGYNLSGAEISTNGKITSELEVRISDGQSVPSDPAGIKALGQKIGKLVKSSLTDTGSYDIYKVMFYKTTESESVTKRDMVGQVFTSAEL